MSEAGDAVNEKNSGEGDVSSVDPNFSNKDDVITRDRVESKEEGTSDSHTSSGNVLKDKEEGDATRTDIKSNIQLQVSPLAETDTKVTSELQVHNHVRFGRSFVLSSPIEEYKMFYIGMEGTSLNNLMLNYNKCQFYSYNPLTRESRKENISVNKALGRRYFLVQKAKEAKTVGILVGTLGAANYLAIIERLKQILKDAGKKYYTVAVGKLNVPKMANFLEIDIYVLVACPENSLIDSHEFYKPVITPFEMELACMRSREWSGDITMSFQDLLPGGAFHVPSDVNTNDKDGEEPKYSLVSGSLVPSKQSSQDTEGGSSSAVVQRSKMEVALEGSAGAQFLHGRSWRGLEQKLGETEVSEPVEGRTGLPVSYSHEHKHNTS